MADKEFEPEDPFEPTAVAISTPGYDGEAAMARCFVEEYALMGWPGERIFRLFTVPDFAASYSIYQSRGPQFIRQLISSVTGEQLAESEEPADPKLRLTPVSRRAQTPG